jgi:outer membrane protein TolC
VKIQLSNLRILARQQHEQDKAVRLSRQTVELALNEYRDGTVAFTTVANAQTADQ